jgi:hypothetical protein
LLCVYFFCSSISGLALNESPPSTDANTSARVSALLKSEKPYWLSGSPLLKMKVELSSRRFFFKFFFTTIITIKLSKIKSCFHMKTNAKVNGFSAVKISIFHYFTKPNGSWVEKFFLGCETWNIDSFAVYYDGYVQR